MEERCDRGGARGARVRLVMACLVVVMALIALAVVSRGSTGHYACGPAAPLPEISFANQKRASATAMRVRVVQHLLVGDPLARVSVGSLATRGGTPIGAQVLITPEHPIPAVSAALPFLLVDDTDTMRPPYQIIRERVQAHSVSEIAIAVLAPSYRRAVFYGFQYRPGGSITPAPGSHDRRPPQPICD